MLHFIHIKLKTKTISRLHDHSERQWVRIIFLHLLPPSHVIFYPWCGVLLIFHTNTFTCIRYYGEYILVCPVKMQQSVKSKYILLFYYNLMNNCMWKRDVKQKKKNFILSARQQEKKKHYFYLHTFCFSFLKWIRNDYTTSINRINKRMKEKWIA